MKSYRKIIIISAVLIGIPIALIIIFLAVAQIMAYNPKDIEDLANVRESKSNPNKTPPSELTILSWNIGYAGLDAESDFVMEGGKMSKGRSKKAIETNMNAVTSFLKNTEAHIYLLQEVDRRADRSYNIDEVEIIRSAFSGYDIYFALNFYVFFVPFPIFDPIGRVKSGILTLSKYEIKASKRYKLPGQYRWPIRLMHLNRCVAVNMMDSPVEGKQWYIINVHLSAYDETGTLRKEQLGFIKEFMIGLYEEGHFVVIGGDWNNLFPGVLKTTFAPYTTDEKQLFWVKNIPRDWTPPDWQWLFDPLVPTTRSNDQPYAEGNNFQTIIDGYLISPNIQILEVKTHNLGFANSDHNPVFTKIRIID
jgi:endonuclease/exonuclease/phosphatase family metal-dependent hydrolase